jgi:hypothetical protein
MSCVQAAKLKSINESEKFIMNEGKVQFGGYEKMSNKIRTPSPTSPVTMVFRASPLSGKMSEVDTHYYPGK